MAHFARRCQPRSGPAACGSACAAPSARRSRSSAVAVLAACSRPRRRRRTPRPTGWSRSSRTADRRRSSAGTRRPRSRSRSSCPKGDTTWIATRSRRRPRRRRWPTATTATSDPVHLGKPLAWRSVKAVGPNGDAPEVRTRSRPGIRRAAGSRRSPATSCRVMASGSSSSTRRSGRAVEIPIDRSVVAAPPVWIDAGPPRRRHRRRRRPAGDHRRHDDGSSCPTGPPGARLLATSADGHRVATMAAPGRPGRRPRHGRLAGRRRLVGRLDRAAERFDDGDRVRARRDRSATRGRLAGRRTAASRWPSTTADRAGGASRNRRSAPRPRARSSPGGASVPNREIAARRRWASQAETGSAAAKIETWASSGSITPKTFWRVRRWTHDPQLSK